MNKCEWKDGKYIPCDEDYIHSLGEECKGLYVWSRSESEWGIYNMGDFDFCPFCGADICKPVEIKVGMFGKFWDGLQINGNNWGYLRKIHKEGYYASATRRYRHFTPGLPAGFNMDGSPKEEN